MTAHLLFAGLGVAVGEDPCADPAVRGARPGTGRGRARAVLAVRTDPVGCEHVGERGQSGEARDDQRYPHEHPRRSGPHRADPVPLVGHAPALRPMGATVVRGCVAEGAARRTPLDPTPLPAKITIDELIAGEG